MRRWLTVMGAVVERDARVALGYRFQWIAMFVSSIIGILLYYYVSRLVSSPEFRDPDKYLAFVIVGSVVAQALAAVLVSGPVSVRQELVAGTFDRLLLGATGPAPAMAATTVVPLLQIVVLGAFDIVFAAVVLGVEVEPSTSALAIPILMLGGLSLLSLMLVMVAGVLVVKQVGGLAGWFASALTLTGGLLFPTSLLPSAVTWLSAVQPLTPFVDLLRAAVLGFPLEDGAAGPVLHLLLFTAITLPLAVGFLNAAITVGLRRGTLLEY